MHGNGYASEGEEAYKRGDYLAASEYYQKKLAGKPDDPQLLFNFGAAAYKNNMYDDAIAAFSGALKSDKIDLQKKAYYNRGNSYYQKGSEVRQADAKATAGHWRQSLNSLKSALELDPTDPDAKYNQSVVAKQLEELEKQLEKEKQEKQDQQGEQNDQQKDKDKDKKDQGQQKKEDNGSDPANEEQQQTEQSSEHKSPGQADGNTDKADAKEGVEQTGEDQPKEAQEPQAETGKALEDQNKTEEQAASDAERQQLGKMTKEEAERLLNALKNEEGNLNFVPSGRRAKDKEIDRDW
jgi:Ca-activated chloride channel family protein